MSVQPSVKGWCPGAFKPMMSGDGLIVRVRPFHARLDRRQVLGLCDLAQTYGNGFLDLTNRANLQIRGVSERGFEPLLAALNDLDLLDATPEVEARRNILVSPFWEAGDDTHDIVAHLLEALPSLPDLPAKFGFAIDTGPAPLLQDASADIRVERSAEGFIVRADGAPLGQPVPRGAVIATILELAAWFAAERQPEERRMRTLLARTSLPQGWGAAAPLAAGPLPVPGPHAAGLILGAVFGQLDAGALARVMEISGARALRVTPWRLFVLEGGSVLTGADFVSTPDDPLLHADACPGAPFCDSTSVETRGLARALAQEMSGTLHVSGCAKGCARRRPADVTLVGNAGRFDLVRQGCAWDAPEKSGLAPTDLLAEVKSH
ncbi:cobalamin biosynthesis protein CobG [uncultured Roseobacter sp.]|uniref:cobalamin biosynthesis protein CobG n=1 Tax=uncultured Roseobacter sp. TaxID=114847 RepID=UPI002632550C|nr:cobalamin biosynthesis protein CobG [uncultured Roseobacter sp.]